VSTPVPSIKSATLLRLAVLVGAVSAYLGLLLSAAADLPGIYLVLLVTAVLLDVYLDSRESWLRSLLKAAQFSLSLRGVLLTLSLALLMVRHFDAWGDGHVVGVVLVAIALPLSRSVYLGVMGILRSRTSRPLATRNIDLGELADPPPPPRWLTNRIERRIVLFGAIPVAAGAVGVVADTAAPFVVVALGYVLILATATVYLGTRLLRSMRLPGHVVWERKTLRRIRDLHPQVVLYFSGPGDSTYQINMWLETLEQLPYRTVVLLREWHALEGLAPTTLPVACIPDGVSVMQAGLFSARVALYPANTSKNLHLLREPGIKHVFIGHGDSDKVSSINPFTRVYDEVWVAGRAGRDRWSRAGVGVRDDAIVEVGRPQLDGVRPVDAAPSPDLLTVLYAPTWEGWNDDTFFTSITQMGPILVRALLDMGPAIRVIYKPHPFTGTRDPKVLRSHEQIVAMLAATNSSPSVLPDDAALTELTSELERADLSVAESRQLSAAWATRYWEVLGRARHVVVDGPRPTLYDCFDHADLLVADVSSVVSDFLATGKPYVCANLQGLAEDDFRRENPTAGAAYLLGADCRELAEIVGLVRGADPREPDRATLREYLLGPDSPPSIARWEAAIAALMVDTADDRTARLIGVDESVLEEVDDAEHATSSDSPTL
jgi:CDP-glycerol glycerophosphotransferase (TagB/SpsB family)